jgi:hypothetical protein
LVWTPDCENESVDWVVERGLADFLVLLRLLAQRFANPAENVKNYFTLE